MVEIKREITLENRDIANELVPKEKRYNQIIEVLTNSNKPLTAKEIAVKMCEKGEIPTSERNFVSPRLTELMKANFVEPLGKKKCEYTKKSVTLYFLKN